MHVISADFCFVSEINITSDPNLPLIQITSDHHLTLQACETQAAASLSLPPWKMLRGLSARSQRRQLMRRTSLLFFRSLKTSPHNYKQNWTSCQLSPTTWALPACNKGHKMCWKLQQLVNEISEQQWVIGLSYSSIICSVLKAKVSLGMVGESSCSHLFQVPTWARLQKWTSRCNVTWAQL